MTDKKDMEEETKEVIDKTSMMEETLMEPVKKKRKRRTKAQIEADKAKENRKKEESQDNKKQKKETKKKKEDLKLSHDDTENHSKVNPLSSMGMADDLFNDVIEPEAIVLHYEKADEDFMILAKQYSSGKIMDNLGSRSILSKFSFTTVAQKLSIVEILALCISDNCFLKLASLGLSSAIFSRTAEKRRLIIRWTSWMEVGEKVSTRSWASMVSGEFVFCDIILPPENMYV